MITTFDKTPPSPSAGTSEGRVGFSSIPIRPSQSRCDVIDECPECPADTAFKYPVSVQDTLYFQFHLEDLYNLNPQSPAVGWFVDMSTDYFVSAEIEFTDGTTLSLPHADIVLSNNVGWFQGSYQNLILSAAAIRTYMVAEGYNNCFRIKITRCRKQTIKPTLVQYINPVLPPTSHYDEGAFIVNSGAIFELINGAWVFDHNLIFGEVVRLSINGLFYEWNGVNLQLTPAPTPTIFCDEICYSLWHKFVNCETTVLIHGYFGTTDCNNNYYGVSSTELLSGIIAYRDQYRLECSFEMRRIFEEKEVNENEYVTSFKQKEEWILRNEVSFPEIAIRRLANSKIATKFYIDSNEYLNPSDLTKKNEEGLFWYFEMSAERDLCQRESDCDDDYSFNPIIECPDCPPIPDCDPVQVEINGVLLNTVASGGLLDVTVKYENGTDVGVLSGGNTVTIPNPVVCADAQVRNSTSTYDVTVASGGVLVLPDTTYNVYVDSILEDTIIVASIEATTININWI